MSSIQILRSYRNIFLDSAPIIYFVENNPVFYATCKPIFEFIQDGKIFATTSPITLAECIVHPIRLGRNDLRIRYTNVIKSGMNTTLVDIGSAISEQAAELRAKYTLTLTDALQLATAIQAGCDCFITNDIRLKRVNEIAFIVISEIS